MKNEFPNFLKIYSVARKKLMQINDILHNVKLDDIKTIQSKLSLSKNK